MKSNKFDRRSFLGRTVAGTAVIAASGLVSRVDAEVTPEPMKGESGENIIRADVLVVGGGSAGHVAAIQAARAGASTIVVERNSQLGGTTTTAGVSFPGLYHAWGKQIIAGIGWELVTQAVELNGGTLPDFTQVPDKHWKHQVFLNGQLYALLAEDACLEAGVSIAYYQFVHKLRSTDDGWLVDIMGQGVEYTIACKQIIDCTGGAEVVAMAGFERVRSDVRQPGTLMFKIGGIERKKLDKATIQKEYQKAIADGRLIKGDCANGNMHSFLLGSGENNNHIFGADSATAGTQTQANLAGRKSLMRLLKFIRKLSGGEHAKIEKMMTETGVRETSRIVGETTLTVNDYTSGRMFDDAICYSFYPIDVHDEHGVKPEPLDPGTFPTIPLGALIPKKSRNIIVAGRCLASDRLANSAARIQASCMGMGQAAGATAALAVKKGCTPLDVPIADIRNLLREHSAIIPGEI